MDDGEEFKKIDTIAELREFLIRKGKSHRIYCQYTSIEALQGMIASSKLHLSVGRKMNDLLECDCIDKAIWERTYTASFTHTALESIAMWCVYSKQLSNTVRIMFRPSMIWKIADEKNLLSIYKVSKRGNVFNYSNIGKPEKVFLCDIVYYRAHSISWNGHVSAQKYPNHNFIERINEQKEMLGLLKHSAWEYEKETRICITLPDNSKIDYPDTIAIDFNGLEGALLMSSPCLEPFRLRHILMDLYQKYKADEKKLKLINSIRYDDSVSHNQNISSLYNKLYLPAFCERCKNKHLGCPGNEKTR